MLYKTNMAKLAVMEKLFPILLLTAADVSKYMSQGYKICTYTEDTILY
jgi:hypothetical protein